MKNVRTMVQCGLFAALITLCAWISIPVPPFAFTLQTLGVLTALGTLGGKRGFYAVVIYLGLGLVGMPVFSGFRSGFSALLDGTGGFLWGFALGALVYRMAECLGKLPAMILCQLTVYVCGCLWFSLWVGSEGFAGTAMVCVVPYVIPDSIKLWLSRELSLRLEKHLHQ